MHRWIFSFFQVRWIKITAYLMKVGVILIQRTWEKEKFQMGVHRSSLGFKESVE